MKFIITFGVVYFVFASIEARGIPKIQIYEIRERGDNNLELKDLDTLPNAQKKIESQLLRLLRPKKPIKKGEIVAQQLIENLKALKGKEGNRLSEDAYIYILHDILSGDNKESSSSEEVFVDRTRNERTETQDRIKNILEKLLRKNDYKPEIMRRNSSPSALRFGDVKTMPPHGRHYDD